MRTRRLGRTGRLVPELGVGGYSFRDAGGREAHIAVIRKAVESGMTLIDTAPGYGASEETIGLALEGVPRDRVVLSTKYYPYGDEDKVNLSGEAMARSLSESLSRLKTDHVDLLHLHWVHSADDVRRILASDLARQLRLMQSLGKVRYLAISEASEMDGEHTMLQFALRTGFFDSVMVTYNVFLQTAERGLFDLARQHGAGVLVMMPLNQPTGGSGLTGRDAAMENLRRLRAEGAVPGEAPWTDPDALDFLTAGTAHTVPQAALRFVLDRPEVTCALVGTASVEHLAEIAAIPDLPPLSPSVHGRARALFGRVTKQVK